MTPNRFTPVGANKYILKLEPGRETESAPRKEELLFRWEESKDLNEVSEPCRYLEKLVQGEGAASAKALRHESSWSRVNKRVSDNRVEIKEATGLHI